MSADTEKVTLKKDDKKDNLFNSSPVKYTFNTEVIKEFTTTITSTDSLKTSEMENYMDSITSEITNSLAEAEERSMQNQIDTGNSNSQSTKYSAGAEISDKISGKLGNDKASIGRETGGTASVGYEQNTEFSNQFSTSDKQAVTNKIDKLVKEFARNSQSKSQSQTNENIKTSSKSVTETLTIKSGSKTEMEIQAQTCKHALSLRTFEFGTARCATEMHFSAKNKVDGKPLVGEALQGLVDTVMPKAQARVLDQKAGKAALWFNIFEVNGLMGNEKSLDQIFDCGCGPNDPEGACKLKQGGGSDSKSKDCCTIDTASCRACKAGIEKDIWCGANPGYTGCNTQGATCCTAKMAECLAC